MWLQNQFTCCLLFINSSNKICFLCRKDDEIRGNSRKRPAAPRGRGRGLSSSKRGKKTDTVTSSIQRMMMNIDDDDDDDDDHVTKKVPASQTRVSKIYKQVLL